MKNTLKKSLRNFSSAGIIALFMFSSLTIKAQMRTYATSGGEIIFSFATIENNNINPNNIVRFSPVFNLQVFGNFDFNKNFGLIAGGSIRNIGFINGNTDANNSGIKKKFRNYNLGIPIGFKIGKLDKIFLFGGYEIEFPFHYKEKTFIDGSKQGSKVSEWFSARTPSIYHTVFAGIQFPYGMSFKFKYYLTGFFDEDFSETVNGVIVTPYKGYKANIFYFSLSFALFQNNKVYYSEYKNASNFY